MRRVIKTKPSRQDHHRRPNLHEIKDPADVFVIEPNTSMRHGPSDGPTVGGSMQADMGAATNLHHLFAIPTAGIGTVLIESNPARSQGVSTSGGHKNTSAGMPPNGIHPLEQHAMLSKRRFPTLGANSSRHPQTKLPLVQQNQLTAGAMQHQLLVGTGTNSSGQQGQRLRVTQPGGNRWNGISRPGSDRSDLETSYSENRQQRRPKHWTQSRTHP